MIIDTKKIQELLDSDITAYRISQETGVHETQIGKYRNKKVKFENMTIDTASKFMEFIRREEMKEKLTIDNLQFSHYDDGDHELEFMVGDKRVFVKVRGLGPLDDENYWDDEENVKKAVQEADKDDIWTEE